MGNPRLEPVGPPPPPKRRGHPCSSDELYSDAETEFIVAVGHWKQRNQCQFPCLTELLDVLMELGYRKP
jgi:hypothetical protein